jgi:hypothetical protein
MKEILPGIWHWTTPRRSLGGTHVSSYWLDNAGVLINPMIPEEGIEWFAKRATEPTAIVLCNRHHYRDSGRFHERFGCDVHAPATGMHQFTAGQPVVPYQPGDKLPGDLVAVEVGALSPDDWGLYSADSKALWLGDTIVREPTNPDAEIGWVVDQLMDEPPKTKQGLIDAFTRILAEYDFEHLLLAHGLPLIGDGRAKLEEFVRTGGRTAAKAF